MGAPSPVHSTTTSSTPQQTITPSDRSTYVTILNLTFLTLPRVPPRWSRSLRSSSIERRRLIVEHRTWHSQRDYRCFFLLASFQRSGAAGTRESVGCTRETKA